MMNMILMPAYGARYATKTEALAAWDAGKDFRLAGTSTYCSKRDLTRLTRLNNRVILHADDGGVTIVERHEKRINPLDFIL